MIGNRKIYLVSFATKEFYKSQEKLRQSALQFGVDEVITYRSEDVKKTKFYEENRDILDRKRGAGYWLWKPYIILETLKKAKDGDVVIYADSGIEIIKDIKPLVDLAISKNDVLIFSNGGESLNRTNTKRDCFILMNCDSEEYWNAIMPMASFNIWTKNEKCIDFAKEWLHFSKNKNIITDEPNICGKTNFPEFFDHRHDQSVLSLLAQKRKKEIFRDPTQWGNHLKPDNFREKNEFIQKPYSDGTFFTNSLYPTFLYHHREKKYGFFYELLRSVKKFLVKNNLLKP